MVAFHLRAINGFTPYTFSPIEYELFLTGQIEDYYDDPWTPNYEEEGRVAWRRDVDSPIQSAATVWHDKSYFGTISGVGHAVDAQDGDVRWTNEEPIAPIICDPAVVDETVYIGDRKGFLRAFDAATGGQRWKYQTGNAVQSKPVITDDAVYFGSNDTFIYAIHRGV